ncbi:SLC13/DASS family transporter [bacterium BFN5]|nr:SLC13/DASS family transporter [bacterium BFN5]
MTPDVITLIVLAVLALLFVTEIVPMAITSIGGAMALGLLGIIPMKVAFSGMSNTTVILFAGMFIIGAAMFHTGLAQTIGEWVVSKVGHGEKGLLFGTTATTAVLSGVTSNTGATAVMMPIVQGICKVANVSQSRQLLPLAYGAGLGGLLTLVGSPPNIIVSEMLQTMGYRPFGFFEFALIGLPLAVVGLAYIIFIGKNFLPERTGIRCELDEAVRSETAATKETAKNPVKKWITLIILVVVLAIMALDLKSIPMYYAAVIGGALCILTRCVTEKQAYAAIDLVTLFVLAGMLPVAAALDQTGAGKLIAGKVMSFIGANPSPIAITVALFILSAGLTQFMTNTATTALLAPIGISIARELAASPQAVLMAICAGATCAFLTPVGSAPCTLVLGPGGYKFMDYVKAGTGLLVVCFIVSIILLPMIWPFFPAQ